MTVGMCARPSSSTPTSAMRRPQTMHLIIRFSGCATRTSLRSVEPRVSAKARSPRPSGRPNDGGTCSDQVRSLARRAKPANLPAFTARFARKHRPSVRGTPIYPETVAGALRPA